MEEAASAAAQQKVQSAAQKLQAAIVNYQNAAVVAGVRGANALAMGANGIPNFRIDTKKDDYDFQSIENVKVRTMNLPEQFDEKGNPKKYTDKEKAELKGKDKDLPGYEAQPDKLEAGQRVRVTLITVKKKTDDKKTDDKDKEKKDANDADKDKDANKDKDKDKAKDANKDKDDEKKMQVKMIVILEEADSGKKKKDN